MSTNRPMRIPSDLEIPDEGSEGLSPLTNPAVGDLAQQIIQSANEGPTLGEAAPPTPPVPNFDALRVALPVGLINPITGQEYREAEVRELNGGDEEYASRGRNYVERKGRMIERGVVTLGGEQVDPSILLSLTQGDREVLLLAISRATYGDEITLDVTCPACRMEQTTVVDLSKDIEIREHDGPQYEFAFSDGGAAIFHWSTGVDEQTVWAFVEKNPKATTAELNTQLLASVLEAVDGNEIVGVDGARGLSLRRRAELMEFISENAPGPRYDTLVNTCEHCEHQATLEVSFGDLFR